MGKGPDKVKETSAERAQAEAAINYWNLALQTGGEAREIYSDRVDEVNTENNRQVARGITQQATAAQYDQAKNQVTAGLSSRGVNPDSGGFQKELSRVSNSQASASGINQGGADNNQTADYLTGISNKIAIGEGDNTAAATGLSDLAGIAEQQAARTAQNDLNDSFSRQQTVGGVVGLGTAYAQNYFKPQSTVSTGQVISGRQGDNDYNAGLAYT